MSQSGTVPVSAPIDTYALGNTYPTHKASRGIDDSAVASFADLSLISPLRVSPWMERYAILEGAWYQVQGDSTTWVQSRIAVTPSDIMLKSVYDPNDDGKVLSSDDSDALEGQVGSFYLDRANHTGTQAQATITGLAASLAAKMDVAIYDPGATGVVQNSQALNGQPDTFYLDRANHTGTQNQSTINNLVADLALKLNASAVGVTVAQLVAGVVPVGQLPFSSTAYLGVYNGTTNVPALANGVGVAGQWVWCTVAGAAGPQGATLANEAVVYNGATWEVGPSVTGSGIQQIDTDAGSLTGATVVLDNTSFIAPSTDRQYSTDDQKDAMDNANAPGAGNPFATMADVGSGGGITSVVTDLGSQGGPTVTIDDTSYIAPSTDRRYMTDDERDAMDAASSPSASNAIATMNDVQAAIVVGSTFLTPELFASTHTTGTGASQTLASLGYNNGTAAVRWPRVAANYPVAINVNTMNLDFISWQEMFYYMRATGSSSCVTPGGKSYYVSHTLYLPRLQDGVASNRRSLSFIIDFKGSRVRNSSGSDMILFDRFPTDQADAMTLVSYQYCFHNGVLRGNSGNDEADTVIRLGSTSRSEFRNLNFESAGQMVDAQFCLEPIFDNINISDYGYRGLSIRNGQWTGAGFSNAQSNIVHINQFRSYNSPGGTPEAAVYCDGNHTIHGNLFTHEGDVGPEHHFFYNNDGTLGVNIANINNIYMEFSGCSRAAYRFRAGKGQFVLNQIRSSVVVSDMPCLIEGDNDRTPTASQHVIIRNAAMSAMDSKLRAVGDPNYPIFWYVYQVRMNNNVTLNTTANFDTGSVANSYVPNNGDFVFEPPL